MKSSETDYRNKERNRFLRIRDLFRGKSRREVIESGITAVALGIYALALTLILGEGPDQNRKTSTEEILMAPQPPAEFQPSTPTDPQIVYEANPTGPTWEPVETPPGQLTQIF